MAALRTPCDVMVHSLQGRPDLNGQRGKAESLDEASGRYHVTMNGGETVALRAANLRSLEAAPPRQDDPLRQEQHAPRPRGNNFAALGALVPPWLEAKHVGMVTAAGLTFGLGVSLINAGLLVALGLMLHGVAKRNGGLGPVARTVTQTIGRRLGVTPAQAGFLVLACFLVLLWWSGLYDSLVATARGSSGASSSSRTSTRPSATGSSNRRRSSSYDGYGDSYGGGGGGGFLGLGSGVDLSFMLGAAMLSSMVWRLGGGGRPEGWSVGHFIHSVQNMDMFQMMMFINLVQQVLGGGRGRRGGMGMPGMGFGRRGMYY